jgi:AcrR family transcriptional regulator
MSVTDSDDQSVPPDMRSRILAAAADLIAEGGVEALTTRAVAAAASVQAPTIYRLFGDKRGLLDAVAEHGLAAYVAAKAARRDHPDPVRALREAWDQHIAFGLAHPAVFAIMHGLGREGAPPAALKGIAILRERVTRIARAGRLRVPEERAVGLIQAVGNGVVATLLGLAAADRDPGLAAAAWDAVLSSILIDGPEGAAPGPAAPAISLRAQLADLPDLSQGERMLLGELLERIIRNGARS